MLNTISSYRQQPEVETMDCLAFTGPPPLGSSWPAECHEGTVWPAWRGWHTGCHLRGSWQETPLRPPARPEERRPAIVKLPWKNSGTPHEPDERKVPSWAEDQCSSGTCGFPLRLWSLVETFSSSWETQGAALKLHSVFGAGVLNQRSPGQQLGCAAF